MQTLLWPFSLLNVKKREWLKTFAQYCSSQHCIPNDVFLILREALCSTGTHIILAEHVN